MHARANTNTYKIALFRIAAVHTSRLRNWKGQQHPSNTSLGSTCTKILPSGVRPPNLVNLYQQHYLWGSGHPTWSTYANSTAFGGLATHSGCQTHRTINITYHTTWRSIHPNNSISGGQATQAPQGKNCITNLGTGPHA